MGLCLKTLPEARQRGSTIYPNPHFHLVFLFTQNKELKTKWHFHKTERKATARLYERSASHSEPGPSPEGSRTAPPLHPTGFLWQKWRGATLRRKCLKVHRTLRCMNVQYASVRMHMFEQAVFEESLLSGIINICLSVFSDKSNIRGELQLRFGPCTHLVKLGILVVGTQRNTVFLHC